MKTLSRALAMTLVLGCVLIISGVVWFIYKPITDRERFQTWDTMLAISRRAIFNYWENTGELPLPAPDGSIVTLIDQGVDFKSEIKGMLLADVGFVPLDPFYLGKNVECVELFSDDRFGKAVEVCGSPLRYVKLDADKYALISAGDNNVYDILINTKTREKLLLYYNTHGDGRATNNIIDNDLVYFGEVGIY